MEVIIEYVLLDNTVIDALLLYCTNKILKIPVSVLGIFLGALFGGVFALISPLLNFGGIFILLAKMLAGFIIVMLSNLSFYKIIPRLVCFVCMTFLFGGMLIAVCYFAGVNVIEGANIVYFSSIPIGALIGCGITLLMLIVRLMRFVYHQKKISSYSVKVELTINNKTVSLQGFVDTGNSLRTIDNIPIVILREDDLKYWFSCADRTNMLIGKYQFIRVKHPQRVDIASVGTRSYITVFDADNLHINGRDYRVAVGVDNSRRFKDFSILLNNKMEDSLC